MDIKKQLQEDITSLDRQIILLDAQLKRSIGAKMYAAKLLERIEKDGSSTPPASTVE